MATGGMNLSKEFFELLKAIGESKSKQEEDRIIAKEVAKLKQKMEPAPSSSGAGGPLSSKKRSKEFLVRLLYVHMLGHEASFGLIKAVEMAASASLYHKRTGYLVCAACLPPEHEFRFMLVNQMQRDLQSPNVLECCGGILACTNIITTDMVPAVAGEVTKLLNHDSATVRKKTIICLHRFHQLAPDVVTESELQNHVERVLCDKDPAVMGASLNVVQSMAAKNPQAFKHVVPSLVAILKQIGDRRLPAEYDYHRLPAPWMQMKLVRILSILGRADAQAASGMYEIVVDTLKKADTGINAGYAVVYECVKCIVTIYPNPALLDAAAEAISRFIQSRSHNLKYLGVTGLAMIVESHPQYAAQHQMAVMDCLEDPDETLQRKTLDLLYRMTNPVNVEFITEKLVDFLSGTTDQFLKKVLTNRVCSIAERYAPNNAWYIQTITKLFEVSGDMVDQSVAQNLMSLIAEGTGESDEADMLLRQNAVEIYVSLLHDKPTGSLPRILLETMAWCLGEYGYLSAVCSIDQVLSKLCQLASGSNLSATTRKFLVTAIFKLVAQAGTCPPQAAGIIDDYTRSRDVDLQQRCLEFQNFLTSSPNLLSELLPVDASAEDVQVDEHLSFLDGYVQTCLSQGARPYDKPEDDDDDDDYVGGSGMNGGGQSTFKMTPYAKPQTPSQAMLAMSGMGSSTLRSSTQASVPLPPGSGGTSATTASPAPTGPPELSLNTRNVANVWGKGGLNQPSAGPTPSRPPAAAPAPVSGGQSAWESQSAAMGGASMSASSGMSSASGYAGSSSIPEPIKTAEQLEKERQAAALFGGIVPGAQPPAPSPAMAAAPAAPPPPTAAAPPPAPPPAPAPVVDLLDMSMWDAAPAPAPDLEPIPAAPPPVVETVSDDDMAVPPAPAPAVNVDPFASAGLLSDVQDSPLETLTSTQKFEYNGTPMGPLPINTAQFGQQWGSCHATSPISVTSTKVTTLDQFMDVCGTIGAHKVEAINATNECIAAGMVGGGSQVVLIHAKLTPQGASTKIDGTIKSTDANMGGSLAMYLQTMLR